MRILAVGGGERVIAAAKLFKDRGDAIRVVTRQPSKHQRIASFGGEPVEGDPDRIGTFRGAFDHATLLIIALGNVQSVNGLTKEECATNLHTHRLDMLLERAIDTTIRGILYETVGDVEPGLLTEGAALVKKRCEFNKIPFGFIDCSDSSPDEWGRSAVAASDLLFAPLMQNRL